MARPRKCRRICALPKRECFGPLTEHGAEITDGNDGPGAGHRKDDNEALIMTLDEYETIRLIDLLNCTQEECAEQMDVARTTVQAVYNNARQKLARCLVEGSRLIIRGGDYKLCSEAGDCCRKNCGGRAGCSKRCGGNGDRAKRCGEAGTASNAAVKRGPHQVPNTAVKRGPHQVLNTAVKQSPP